MGGMTQEAEGGEGGQNRKHGMIFKQIPSPLCIVLSLTLLKVRA